MSTKSVNHEVIQINREDMLELTRRMTLKRNCFSRVAGAYFDEEGYVDGTFNTHFLKLSAKEKAAKLTVAKAVPFASTNINLKGYHYREEDEKPGGIWQILMGVKDCELKNDALLDVLYEVVGEGYPIKGQYAFCLFHGSYDVPLKASDKENLRESEEVYRFMIGTICSYNDDYELGIPEWGFLFPLFSDRSSDIHGIAIYNADSEQQNFAGFTERIGIYSCNQ